MSFTLVEPAQAFEEELDLIASILARFSKNLLPKVDEFHCFLLLREYVLEHGLSVEGCSAMVDLVITTTIPNLSEKTH